MLALELAVGFAFADAAVAWATRLRASISEIDFGAHERGDFGGDGGACGLGGGGLGWGGGEQKDDLAADEGAGGEVVAEVADRAAQELFVQLGELAGDDEVLGRAEDGGDVGEGVQDAVRGFVEDVRGVRCAARVSRLVRRWPALAGRKPWKVKLSVGRPLAMRAVRAALAPGMGKTGMPAAMAAEAMGPPGSAMPGVPASETTAMRAPALSSAMSSEARDCSLCMW